MMLGTAARSSIVVATGRFSQAGQSWVRKTAMPRRPGTPIDERDEGRASGCRRWRPRRRNCSLPDVPGARGEEAEAEARKAGQPAVRSSRRGCRRGRAAPGARERVGYASRNRRSKVRLRRPADVVAAGRQGDRLAARPPSAAFPRHPMPAADGRRIDFTRQSGCARLVLDLLRPVRPGPDRRPLLRAAARSRGRSRACRRSGRPS